MGLTGMNDLVKKVERLESNLHDDVTDAVEEDAEYTATAAKGIVVHENTVWSTNLYRSIGVKRTDMSRINSVKIHANVPYAAYVEFGTGARGQSSVSPRFQFEAPPFSRDLFKNIQAWVMQKPAFYGTRSEEVAYKIAQAIAEKGTNPHPFMRPAWHTGKRTVVQNAESAVQRAVNRY